MRYLPLLLPCLLLSACSSQNDTAKPVVIDPQTMIQGKITDWQGTQGNVSVVIDGKTLNTAPVTNDGQFNLALPTHSQLSGLGTVAGNFPSFVQGCVNNQRVSDASARLVTIKELQLIDSAGQHVLQSDNQAYASGLDATTHSQYWLVYAARPTQIYGDVVCEATSLRSTYSFILNFQAGWNMVQIKQSLSNSSMLNATAQFSTVPLVANTSWHQGAAQMLNLPLSKPE